MKYKVHVHNDNGKHEIGWCYKKSVREIQQHISIKYFGFTSATDVKVPATPEKKITVIEDKPVSAQSVESVKEAIQHGVHVQEMRMKEYLLPILLGAGVGFILLVLCLSLLICCCCKRKLKKKIKMAKEMEKPAKDGKLLK